MTEPAVTTGRPRRENALLTLFRIPVFRRMWAAITFSSFGDWLGLLANTALAQQLTHQQSVATQGVAISGVILVRLAPDLVFGAIAAAMADKLDRRKTVIVGEVAAGILYASIALGYNLVWLYVAQFLIEAAGLFTQSAKQVIWIGIIPKKLLATGNQVSLISVYGMVPVASGVFALLSAVDRLITGGHGPGTNHVSAAIVIALLLDTVTFFVSATTVFVSRGHIPVMPADREREQGILSLLREGVVFVRRNRLIRALYVGIIGAFAAGGLTVGVAQLWVATLSAGAAGYSIMFGTVFTGLAIGMLVGPRVLPTYARSRVFGLAIGSAGVALLIMSVIRNLIIGVGLAALIGMFAGMAWIIGYTLIGQEVEDRLRGRIWAFVMSSVRITLLLTIAIGPVLAGFIGSHSIGVGSESNLRFSGPGLTLFIGGVVALLVSWYTTARSTQSRTRVRHLLRRQMLRAGVRGREDHLGLFVSVDGTDPVATAGYARLVAAAVRSRGFEVCETAEPTQSPTGRRVAELVFAETAAGVEPETAALLSAADRAEHVAAVVRPALERGAVVVCDRFVLTSLAIHGGGWGADTARVRSINMWSTGELLPDLTIVVDGVAHPAGSAEGHADLDEEAMHRTLLDEADTDPDRYVICPADAPAELPEGFAARLGRLMDYRSSLLALTPPAPGAEPAADAMAPVPVVAPIPEALVPESAAAHDVPAPGEDAGVVDVPDEPASR